MRLRALIGTNVPMPFFLVCHSLSRIAVVSCSSPLGAHQVAIAGCEAGSALGTPCTRACEDGYTSTGNATSICGIASEAPLAFSYIEADPFICTRPRGLMRCAEAEAVSALVHMCWQCMLVAQRRRVQHLVRRYPLIHM